MPGHDLIVIGASAGGVQAITEIAASLPADLPAAVFVVVHMSPVSPGILPSLIDRAGPLPAEPARDGETIRHGRIYVARPDYHLLIDGDRMRVGRGPRENGFRPAVDPLFRTAARSCGPRVIGVVLSGGLDDGTEGLLFIKRHGGVAIVQDPDEAPFPSMPNSAVENVEVDHVLQLRDIPDRLVRLAREPVRKAAMSSRKNGNNGLDMPETAEAGDNSLVNRDMPGPPSSFTCPE